MANEDAIKAYRRMIVDENINCSFEEQSAFVYGNDSEQLRIEAEAAATLGLPASFVRETTLPFPTAMAVRFSNQAQFHPLRFLEHVA